MPKYADSPSPPAKIVSASPDTIWLARRVIVRKAWIAAIAAPPAAAASTASGEHRGARSVDALCRPVPDGSAEQHHPLDPEVEHTRALGEELAERRVQKRSSVQHGLGEYDDEEAVVDHAASDADGSTFDGRRRTRTR